MEGVQTMNDAEIRGAIIGMVLGDGSLPMDGRSTNAHMDFAHCAKQKEYAVWKAGLLENLTSMRITDGVSHCQGKAYPKVRILSKTHPVYTHLRNRFYHNGRKTVDSFLMNQLTPLGLAIWYMDDGNLNNHEDFLTPKIETNCFNVAEHHIMTKALADNYHLEFRVNHLNAKYLYLRLRRKDREKFFDIIREHIHPTMAYKIQDDGKTVMPTGDPIQSKCEICGTGIVKAFTRRNDTNRGRFCRVCYNSHRSAIGTTRNQFSEPRDSRTLPAMVGVC
jgi:recombination protein RecA